MIVVDASIAIKWLVNEPGHEAARTFLPQWQGDRLEMQHILIAPALIELEVHNVMAGKLHRNEISLELFSESDFIIRQYIQIDPIDSALINVARNASLAAYSQIQRKAGHQPATFKPFNIYDCIYIAYAKHNGATLLTADREQAAAARALDAKVTYIQP